MSFPTGKSVLVIDDEPDYRRLIAEVLEMNGWRVLEAEQGDVGVELAKQHHPSVVICDLLMPRYNGFQVCQAIRRHEALAKTKILVSSGRDFDSDRQAALAAGADQYLTKPLDLGKLVDILAGYAPSTPTQVNPDGALADKLSTLVRFWGVRGSIPTPGAGTVVYGGNTTCVEVRAGGQIIILDAGTGIRLLGKQLMAEFGDKPVEVTLLLTHTHWDHIQGLPFFLPVYHPQNKVRILGYEGARHGLDNVLSNQMESPFFPVGLQQVGANVCIEELKEMSFDLGSVRVETCFANHPGVCVGYRLHTPGGKISFFPDNEPRRGARRAHPAGYGNTAAREFASGQERKLVDFIRDSEVLIMDTQYDCEEYKQYVGWGHGCVNDVVSLALDADVKQLFLFHHDPNHDDEKVRKMEAAARDQVESLKRSLRVQAAREGATVELPALSTN
jgi:phosphoribosyl 1,2-cyclic phosphodiesterase